MLSLKADTPPWLGIRGLVKVGNRVQVMDGVSGLRYVGIDRDVAEMINEDYNNIGTVIEVTDSFNEDSILVKFDVSFTYAFLRAQVRVI